MAALAPAARVLRALNSRADPSPGQGAHDLRQMTLRSRIRAALRPSTPGRAWARVVVLAMLAALFAYLGLLLLPPLLALAALLAAADSALITQEHNRRRRG